MVVIVADDELFICISVPCGLQLLYEAVAADSQGTDGNINIFPLWHSRFLLIAENPPKISNH